MSDPCWFGGDWRQRGCFGRDVAVWADEPRRLVGFVFVLSVVAAASGGCADNASSPVKGGEQERGLEQVVGQEEPRGEPKPQEEAKAEPAKGKPEAAPPPPEREPQPRPEPMLDFAPAPDAHDATATVTRVVDGDTIQVYPAIDGVTDVRLIGVDTPETKEPGCAPQPYGPETPSYAESVVSGQQVELEFDAERTDRYGRLLAYVYPQGGGMFNEDLIAGGLRPGLPLPAQHEVRRAVRCGARESAIAAGLGIWSLGPDGLALLTDRGYGVGGNGCSPLASEPPQYQAPVAPAPVPYPDVPPTPAAPPVVGGDLDCKDFGSLAEVRESITAGDPHGLDADGDGSGCESQF